MELRELIKQKIEFYRNAGKTWHQIAELAGVSPSYLHGFLNSPKVVKLSDKICRRIAEKFQLL